MIALNAAEIRIIRVAQLLLRCTETKKRKGSTIEKMYSIYIPVHHPRKTQTKSSYSHHTSYISAWTTGVQVSRHPSQNRIVQPP